MSANEGPYKDAIPERELRTYERRRFPPIRKVFPKLVVPSHGPDVPRKCPNCGTKYFGLAERIVCHVCKQARV